MSDLTASLLTDLYQLNMVQACLDHEQTKTAVFEFFVRTLPERRGFLIAAGLEQAIEFLEAFHFTTEDIEWLESTGRFGTSLLEYLSQVRFTGDVHAMPEGTVFFANEPILRVTAPLPQAQLAETRLINILHIQSLVASKAARMVLTAFGKPLVDFGLRRAHGAEAGLMAARASYAAGFAGTATVLAEKLYVDEVGEVPLKRGRRRGRVQGESLCEPHSQAATTGGGSPRSTCPLSGSFRDASSPPAAGVRPNARLKAA